VAIADEIGAIICGGPGRHAVPSKVRPGSQTAVHAEATQARCPSVTAGHARPQPPQCETDVCVSASQPLLVFPSQSAVPGPHTLPHTLAAQVATALGRVGHALPQDPQWAGVLRVSTSQPLLATPSQSAKPAAQVNLQAAATHAGVALARAGHTVPHAPQWVALDRVSTSQPLVTAPSQSPKPWSQVATAQTPRAQVGAALAGAHGRPHAPQCAVLLASTVSQPLPATPSQSAKPARHAPPPHTPAAHRACWLPVIAQAIPHTPQFVAELAVSTSQPLSATPSQLPKPASQARAQAPSTQAGVALVCGGHRLPQRPQLVAALRRSVSQPLAASASQSPKPAAQARPHTPAAQVGVALAPAGHTIPHAPQWVTAVEVAVSQPLAAAASQSPKPAAQASAQTPARQAGDALGPDPQGTASQAPQRVGSFCRLMQRMPQRTSPAAQSLPHV
jgi:hypothetical protein